MTRRFPPAAVAALALLAASVDAQDGGGVATLRDAFEDTRTAWRRESADTDIAINAHDRSERAAHEGRRSERFLFTAGQGSGFYVSYPVPKVPASDDFRASIYVRSNRPGVQLSARVVLPRDVDPETGQPSFVIVPGSTYEAPDRWQRLELVDIRRSVERQARILRTSTKRPLPVDGAYVERLVMNLYGGEGQAEVFLDELSVSPVPAAAAEGPRPGAPAVDPEPEAARAEAPRAGPGVSLLRDRLKKDGYGWSFVGIRAPGADAEALRAAGFDVIAVDPDEDPARLARLVAMGFKLMPMLGEPDGGGPMDAAAAVAKAAAFPAELQDAVAFWHLGDRLGAGSRVGLRDAELAAVRDTIGGIRRAPGVATKLVTGNVSDLFAQYTLPPRALDLMGLAPPTWGTMMEMSVVQRYVVNHRNLAGLNSPDALVWSEVRATPYEALSRSIWGDDPAPAWGNPRVQPEQVRLAAFASLAAGARGLMVRGDAELTRPQGMGRALLNELALLNEEVDLVESILAEGSDPIRLLDTFRPEPPPLMLTAAGGLGATARAPVLPEAPPLPFCKAAAIGTADKRGYLLLVADYGWQAQYQPDQLALNNLKIIAPAGTAAQPYEISPGGVEPLDRERIPGGTRITVPNFGVATIILVTTDTELVARIRAAVEAVRPRAVALAIEGAQQQRDWVAEVHGRIAEYGHPVGNYDERLRTPKGQQTIAEDVKARDDLIAACDKRIKAAREALESENYAVAWAEARLAPRYLRALMYAHYFDAYNDMMKLISPPPDPEELVPPRVRRAPKKPRKPAGPLLAAVSSPAMVSFNTLPQHWIWYDLMKNARFGRNLLPSGSFDDPDEIKGSGWQQLRHEYEGIEVGVAHRPTETGRRGVLELAVSPIKKEKADVDRLPTLLDFPAVAVRSPAIQLSERQFVRVSVWIHMPRPVAPGAGGLVVRDSIGGEMLQFRMAEPIVEWQQLFLWRRAPADGPFTVTLGLSGYGEVWFDDLRVERFVDPSNPPAADDEARDVARRMPPVPRVAGEDDDRPAPRRRAPR